MGKSKEDRRLFAAHEKSAAWIHSLTGKDVMFFIRFIRLWMVYMRFRPLECVCRMALHCIAHCLPILLHWKFGTAAS